MVWALCSPQDMSAHLHHFPFAESKGREYMNEFNPLKFINYLN